ncbi:MAG: hypothetical protein IJ640_00930 [Prevotella sp.]|nr:hypothetical protein [Prevotella sp.]
MIPEFVRAWDANKDKLKYHIATHKMKEYSEYEDLVRLLFEIVINPYFRKRNEDIYNVGELQVIGDGDCTGTAVFILPVSPHSQWQDDYINSHDDYVFTHNKYGSCAGCDTLMGIQHYQEGTPTEKQIDEHMTLCLHLLQRCKRISDE